jgi:hypothetical protein
MGASRKLARELVEGPSSSRPPPLESMKVPVGTGSYEPIAVTPLRVPSLELVDLDREDVVDLDPADVIDLDDDDYADETQPRTIPPPLPPTSGITLTADRDPADVLFDAIDELPLAKSVREAAEICAAALAKALSARAVIVHQHHLVRGELRAIAVHGWRAADLVGSCERANGTSPAARAVREQAQVVTRVDEAPSIMPPRFVIVGAKSSVLATPVVSWGRCIALIEVVDADERWVHLGPAAATYVAKRLAEFVSGRT